MASGAVATAHARDLQHDEKQGERDRDDDEHLHPTGCSVSVHAASYFTRHRVYMRDVAYIRRMPKVWGATIEAHRQEVREAIMDRTWALVTEQGLRSVTMSRIAEETGIGRATLYKYFPDVEAIVVAWHRRHVAAHLERLAELRDDAADAAGRVEAVVVAYALIAYHRGHHGMELAALLHRDEQVAAAWEKLLRMFRDVLAEAAASGDVRDDVAPDELARYCLHALAGAGSLRSQAAVRRLAAVTLAGLRPPR